MTRDVHRIRDDRGASTDADIYTALSRASAPFPRLPEDAPTEVGRLTVDLYDPKRIYAVYRAGRRHHFQLLVERYIHQIRYGCQSKACVTASCFSCRRRLANGAPVRRYNATSARTLAVYMASQDNPEKALCHNPSAPYSVLEKSGVRGPNRMREGRQNSEQGLSGVIAGPADANPTIVESRDTTEEARKDGRRVLQDGSRLLETTDLSVLDEPTATDPRSFVQSVFGTVAFKMVEWLTPRNLDRLVRSQREHETQTESVTSSYPSGPTHSSVYKDSSSKIEGPPNYSTSVPLDENSTQSSQQKTTSTERPPAPIPNAQLSHARDPKFSQGLDSSPNSLSRLLTANNETIESQQLKGILSKAPRQSEIVSDLQNPSRQYVSPVSRKLSRKSSGTSPRSTPTETIPANIPDAKLRTSKIVVSHPEQKSKDDENAPHATKSATLIKKAELFTENNNLSSDSSTIFLPTQSLFYFTVEVIELLCNVMQDDGTSERHSLYPIDIGTDMQRTRPKATQLQRMQGLKSSLHKLAWKAFIEQSIFDVLSRPDALLRSFRDENTQLFDTHTIWYLMLRMTRVAPSLVFDSLWRLSGGLFQPSEKLESTCEWTRDSTGINQIRQKPFSNHDAAEIISVCLHALIAAAPLATTKQELASMSRIRSYGLTIRGSELASQEHINLCLQYEDAFTHELAVRLARRVFAAIALRRRFAELLDLQHDPKEEEKSEPDVLETLIKSLKALDLGTESVLNFSNDERDLHEKRVPTLILDWARTVMLQEWQGTAEVPSDGPFGGALATMNALYENRKALFLGDIHFRTEYFAERLDAVDMPISWLSFEPNKKCVHLLDYPYLFNPSTLVTYFRSLNFSRMNRAYETAKASGGLMYSTMAETNLMVDKNQRDQLHGLLEIATTRFNVLEIGRTEVLKDTFNAIWRREERELLRPLKVRLGQEDGDEGMDSGGVQQEFFRLAIAEAVNPDYGAFTIDPTTQMIWFQPGSPEPLWKFELIGMIVSLAIYNGLTLPVTFPTALYRKLLDEEVSELHHIEDGWPDIAKNLTQLLEWDEKEGLVEDVFVLTYEFSTDLFGKPISREMGKTDVWPQFSESLTPPQSKSSDGGTESEEAPMVTNSNRNAYVSDYIHYLTDISIRPQFSAFRRGFLSCLPPRSLSLFTSSTLQSLLEGIQEIDISEMRRATNYVGWNTSHRTVRDFWSIVKRYSLEQKKKLLEFTTASERVPVGGMRNLQFTLQRNGVGDGHLPTSYTCYGILLLPEYSSKEVLREKLAMALENSKGFGFA